MHVELMSREDFGAANATAAQLVMTVAPDDAGA
jgi:hypothetical protein